MGDKKWWPRSVDAAVVIAALGILAPLAVIAWAWRTGSIKSEVAAAWVQAVGSVAAIWVAIWLGHRTAAAEAAGARNYYRIFKASVWRTIGSARVAALENRVVDLRYGHAMIHESIRMGQSVPLQHLREGDALTATRLQAVIAMAGAALDFAFRREAQYLEMQYVAKQLREIEEELNKLD